jgi:hypothetical protein
VSSGVKSLERRDDVPLDHVVEGNVILRTGSGSTAVRRHKPYRALRTRPSFVAREASFFTKEALTFTKEALTFAKEAFTFTKEALTFAKEAFTFAKEAFTFANETLIFAKEGSIFAKEASIFAKEGRSSRKKVRSFQEHRVSVRGHPAFRTIWWRGRPSSGASRHLLPQGEGPEGEDSSCYRSSPSQEIIDGHKPFRPYITSGPYTFRVTYGERPREELGLVSRRDGFQRRPET